MSSCRWKKKGKDGVGAVAGPRWDRLVLEIKHSTSIESPASLFSSVFDIRNGLSEVPVSISPKSVNVY